MHPAIHRVLAAYRPLYLNGLLKDGHYRLPAASAATASAAARPRMLLVALLPSARPHRR
jgi:hypothetical protein